MRNSTLVQNAGGLERGRLDYKTAQYLKRTLHATNHKKNDIKTCGNVVTNVLFSLAEGFNKKGTVAKRQEGRDQNHNATTQDANRYSEM